MRGATDRRFDLKSGGPKPFNEARARQNAQKYGVESAEFDALPDAAQYAWEWVAFNERALEGAACQPNTRTVLYEDICRQPERIARDLLAFVGLDWTEQTARFIARSTTHVGKTGYYAVLKNSVAAADRWRSTMCPEDQAAVRDVVGKTKLALLWPDLANLGR